MYIFHTFQYQFHLMKLLNICFLLITVLSAQGQENNPSFEFLVYGLRKSNTFQNAQNNVADRWNIHFKSIATCLISKELKDSAAAFNHHSDSLISIEYGKNWHQHFDQEVASEEALIEQFIFRLKKMDCIIRLDSLLAKASNDVNYLIYPFSISKYEKKYEALVFGWGTIDGKTDLVCYYQFKLYKHRKKIKRISEQAHFLFKEP